MLAQGFSYLLFVVFERRRGSRTTQNLCSVGKIYIASALLYCRGLCACFSGHAQR